jgi:hypothetical protein
MKKVISVDIEAKEIPYETTILINFWKAFFSRVAFSK